jgi:hypothetical protein
MVREEKFLELGKLYAEIHRLTNRVMELMDEPSADFQFEKAVQEESAKIARKKGKKEKKAPRPRKGKKQNYKCRDCGAEFTSTASKLDVLCNDCGSAHIS